MDSASVVIWATAVSTSSWVILGVAVAIAAILGFSNNRTKHK